MMKANQSVHEVIAQISKHAQKGDNDTRVARRIEIGSVVQQGDLYLHRVADTHPKGELLGKGKVQLALGTSKGARHYAEGPVAVYAGVQLPDGVIEPEGVEAGSMLGPVVVADGPWSVPHPEHAQHKLPGRTYQVTYQFNPLTMKRVVD